MSITKRWLSGARRKRTVGVLLAAGAVAATMLVVVPALGQPDPDADRLTLTPSMSAFHYDGTEQPITLGRKCLIDLADAIPPAVQLVTLSSNARGPGLVDFGIGVKSGGSNGTPCSQVDSTEWLTITSAAASWDKLELDIEAKGNADIRAELWLGGNHVETHRLLTGSSIQTYNAGTEVDEIPIDTTVPYVATTTSSDLVEACANPSDSGPDSGPRDNCRWTIDSDHRFDSVVLFTTVGTVSLEGGSDLSAFEGFAQGLFDSLFYRADSPVAADDSYEINEDTTLFEAAPGVLENDTDPYGGSLTASLVEDAANGTLVLSEDGSFIYEPDENYFGPDSFTYQASAGGATSGVATVNITVNSVNDPPEPKDVVLNAVEDTPFPITADDLAADADGDTLEIDSATADNGAFDDGEYTPEVNFCGPDTLTFSVSDGNGGLLENATVAINVACVNDAPVAVDDPDDPDDPDYEVDEIDTLTITAAAVLANDYDVDNDPPSSSGLSAVLLGEASRGTVTQGQDGSFSYVPDSFDEGEFVYDATFQYQAFDGVLYSNAATVTVTVFRVICSGDEIDVFDGDISGNFKRLGDIFECKRFTASADAESDTIVFQPQGGAPVYYRGVLEFGSEPAVGGFTVRVLYNVAPDVPGSEYVFAPWCINPQFEAGLVVEATIPAPDTVCTASAYLVGDEDGDVFSRIQVFFLEDPGFRKG